MSNNTKQTQHTPGPWKKSFLTVRQCNSPVIIADCIPGHVESEANALLMAVSPELLDALEGLTAALLEYSKTPGTPQLHGPVCIASEKARKVIAKAKGE